MKKNETFTIVDSVNSDGIIAVREKSSVEINEVDINNIPQITNPFNFYIKIK